MFSSVFNLAPPSLNCDPMAHFIVSPSSNNLSGSNSGTSDNINNSSNKRTFTRYIVLIYFCFRIFEILFIYLFHIRPRLNFETC